VFSSQSVVTLFPAPIAFAYRRFYQDDSPRSRLDAMFCVLEACLRYLLTLGLSDLFRALAAPGREKADVPAHEAFDFLRRRRPVSLGGWVTTLVETARALQAEQAVVSELAEMCGPGKPLIERLFLPLVRRRNACVHSDGSISISPEECKDALREGRPLLDEALRELRFLCRYPLGFVTPFASIPSGGGVRYYHLHGCMGAWVRSTGRAVDIRSDVELRPEAPFVVTPDGSRLLYLWPMLLERRSAYTGRRSLWSFQEVPDDKGRYLTRARWAAIDGREDHSEHLHPTSAASLAWLWRRLREMPMLVGLPDGMGLVARLLPHRGGKLVGQEVGSNRLLAIQAIGGFGTIYTAEAADGTQVAVKVVEARLADTQLARFRQEFEKLRRAGEHPGVVRCFEFGDVYLEGRVCPWYSMEFAPGGDLKVRIEGRKSALRGEMPWSDAVARVAVCTEFIQVASAVAHLHRMGLVHRDIKPGNILIMEDGGLRLSDFGLVKNLRPSEETAQAGPHTTTGAGAGTPGYMAPEQARGEEVDQRADVYSLGVLLAELATGERPKVEPGAVPGAGSAFQGWPALKRLPGPLRALIERCTEFEPGRRPRDAEEALALFRAAQGG
jgi:hypothetical protein